VIDGLIASGLSGIVHLGIHGTLETITTDNVVNVTPWYARKEDRIRALDRKGLTVHCESIPIKGHREGGESTQTNEEEQLLTLVKWRDKQGTGSE
jgi:hypothetical protein